MTHPLKIRYLPAITWRPIRDGLSDLLASTIDFQVVGLARDGLEAVEKTRELHPYVVIIDSTE